MATTTDTTSPAPAGTGLGIGAIAFAVIATLLAIYALGVSLATRNGGVAVADGTTAAAAGTATGGDTVTVELTEFAIDGALDVAAGQAVVTDPGEWVRYSTPDADGAEYVAVCLPAFSPDGVHRDV